MPVSVTNVTSDSPSRALIALGPRLERHDDTLYCPISRPSAVFIAQLIATAEGAPQTRARRRAGPEHAAAMYAAAACRVRPLAVERSL